MRNIADIGSLRLDTTSITLTIQNISVFIFPLHLLFKILVSLLLLLLFVFTFLLPNCNGSSVFRDKFSCFSFYF